MNLKRFTNCYPVSKTLRFKLIPVGRTLELLNLNRILDKDEIRAEEYKKAKEIIDRYHISFIEKSLCDVKLDGVENYILLCLKKNKTDEDVMTISATEIALRKQISNIFLSQDGFKSLFDKDLITKILPKFVSDEKELEIINNFSKFTTAFVGFNENRKNIYTSDPIPTAIPYRCINDNLPKYISNIHCYESIKSILSENIENLDTELANLGYSVSINMFFSTTSFSLFLSQSAINLYNSVIGGWTTEDGTKIQGLNEYINLYNQHLSKSEKDKRLPKFQMLFKQILSESESVSFHKEGLKDDREFILTFKDIFTGDESIYDACIKASELVTKLEEYRDDGIYVINGQQLTAICKGAFGEWNAYCDAWAHKYREENPIGRSSFEKYEEKLVNSYKKTPSFSLYEIDKIVNKYGNKVTSQSVMRYFQLLIKDKITDIKEKYSDIENLLNADVENYEKTEEDINSIKNVLDAIKNFEHVLEYLVGTGLENNRDDVFYGEFIPLLDCIRLIDPAYDLIRNYVTKKPFSKDKYKLYFDQGDFMSGWDAGGNGGKRCGFLLKDGKYYLMVSASNTLPTIETDDSLSKDFYEKIEYRLLSGANKMLPKVFFSKSHIDEFCPSDEIKQIKETESFKKGPKFKIDDCHKLIEFYQDCISKHEWGSKFGFKFKKPSEYEDISKFYRDVECQGYKLVRHKANANDIDTLLNDGKVYLFQIYNKDFSEYSHGRPNLHTMYFKALFDEQNQSVIKLNGGAEMFMRKASIKEEDKIIHPAGTAISSKNADNLKRSSTFMYDLIKDKRYTVDQFEFHVPIQINWTTTGNVRINDNVRVDLKNSSTNYVIGIDRGERNLLYVCVIDDRGKIIEQYSLNNIINEYKGVSHKTDYHRLLDQKETERKLSRQNWTTIENIKELKEGYISQVVHKICQLVVKYNAVIALEDLNSGFKKGRTKVEKQVYQKFEKALIDKLNYMSDKGINLSENGSILHGYQLTEKFDSFSRMRTQNGIMFYIPAWLTSKIDPTTGFADLLKPKYVNIESCQKFIMSFDKISFSEPDDMFVFELDYSKFPRAEADYNKKWKLYTNGSRIKTFRNPAQNNEWDHKEVWLTKEMRNLLSQYNIFYSDGNDLRSSFVSVADREFYLGFIDIVKLMIQMRNSISGRTDVDFLISPVKNCKGNFYDSRHVSSDLPIDADANGAYNIARKVLWVIEQFKTTDIDSLSKVKIAISNKEWLQYAQTHSING